MRRLFWVGVGVAVTVVVLRQVSKVNGAVGAVAHAVSPAGISEQVGRLADTVKDLGEQLRTSMAENEKALTDALLPSEEQQASARAYRASRRPGSDRGAPDPWDVGDDVY